MILKNYYRLICAQTLYADVKIRNWAGTWVEKGGDNNGGAAVSIGSNLNSPTTPSIFRIRQNITDTYGGVHLGTGDTPVTPDDYKLSGDIISTFSYTAKQMHFTKDENGGGSVSVMYTITNTGTEAFTIKEIGLISKFISQGDNSVLLERTVLDVPITIEPDGVGQLTYTFTISVPS